MKKLVTGYDARDRFFAGALLRVAWVQKAQRVRHWSRHQTLWAFANYAMLLAVLSDK